MTIRRTALLLASLLLASAPLRASERDAKHEGFSELTIDQVDDLIRNQDADIFDSNGKDVYDQGHIPTAKWVSFKDVKQSDLPGDYGRKLVFYCANSH